MRMELMMKSGVLGLLKLLGDVADWELQLSLVRMSEVHYPVGKSYWLTVLTPVLSLSVTLSEANPFPRVAE